jgi:hypothetical protein
MVCVWYHGVYLKIMVKKLVLNPRGLRVKQVGPQTLISPYTQLETAQFALV